MDFASLTVGCVFRHVTWPTQRVRVVEPKPLPSPNAAQAEQLVAQFKQHGIEVPADVQKLVDNLLAVKAPEPSHRLPEFVYIDFDGSEKEWQLTLPAVFDRGYVLVSGTPTPDVTEAEAEDALAASVAAYG